MSEMLRIPEITMILPSLNVASYIGKCIESVRNQTFSEIEILCVDAGSTDGTLEILAKHAGEDSRIRILHSEIKSYGYQMNLALREAKGKYIAIAETDDIAEPTMCEMLYQTIEETGADFVKGVGKCFWELPFERYEPESLDIKPLPAEKSEYGKVWHTNAHPELFVADNFLWTGLYRKEFLCWFPFSETNGAAFQDIGVLFRMLGSNAKGVYLDVPVYHYRQDNSSASSVNPWCFRYIVTEYGALKPELDRLSDGWTHIFYKKLFLLLTAQFLLLAEHGIFLESEDIDTIREWLLTAYERGQLRMEDFLLWHQGLFEKFRESTEALYRELTAPIQRVRKSLAEIFRKIDDAPVIVFGTGKYGQLFAREYWYNYGKAPVAYIDNQNAGERFIDGTPIEAPDEVSETVCQRYPDAFYVVANRNDSDAMRRQLLGLGIAESRVLAYDAGRLERLVKIL